MQPPERAFDPSRIQDSFAQQGLMGTIGARLVAVRPGRVEIALPFSPALTQQNGFFHAAAVAAIADSAGGYAALSVMSDDEDVLAVEFKLNLVRPAIGDRLVAEGTVLRAGRTLIVCQNTVLAYAQGSARTVAVMLQTNIRRPLR
jgi:uncharacterized protein (TIGR00369 family)